MRERIAFIVALAFCTVVLALCAIALYPAPSPSNSQRFPNARYLGNNWYEWTVPTSKGTRFCLELRAGGGGTSVPAIYCEK